jgi:GT2 family glycosyltransferase
MKPRLSIIYIYYNTPKEIVDSISSLRNAIKNISYEILIVNNASPKKIPQEVLQNKKITIFQNTKNLGFGKAVNQAAEKALGEYLLVINPDTLCTKNSIFTMVTRMEKDKKIGVLGPQLQKQNGEILHSIGSVPKLPDSLFVFSFLSKLFPNNSYSKNYWAISIDRNIEQETETVGGACMLFRKNVFQKVRGFDERFFMYFEEIDICLRIKTIGYKIIYFPKSVVIHFVGKSTNNKQWIQKTYEESRFKFFEKKYGTPIAFFAEAFLRLSSVLSQIKN